VPLGNGRATFVHREDLGELYRLVIENSGTGYFTGSEGMPPTQDELVELAKKITGVNEVEKVENVWEHIHEYGFALFGLSVCALLDAKRGRELYGFAPRFNLIRDGEREINLEY
jgi:nucleoside-diphosphate-sugar epimerase